MSTEPEPEPEVIIRRLPDGRDVALGRLPARLRAAIRAAVEAGASAGDFEHRGRFHMWELAAGPRPIPGFYASAQGPSIYHVAPSGAIRLVHHDGLAPGDLPRIRARLPEDARPLSIDPDRARELLRGADD
jgi:hypothetical protein